MTHEELEQGYQAARLYTLRLAGALREVHEELRDLRELHAGEWRPVSEIEERTTFAPLMGWSDGTMYLMLWSEGSEKINEAFRAAFPDAEGVIEHPPGWYMWGGGLRCYFRNGDLIRVHPEYFRLPPAPPPEVM